MSGQHGRQSRRRPPHGIAPNPDDTLLEPIRGRGPWASRAARAHATSWTDLVAAIGAEDSHYALACYAEGAGWGVYLVPFNPSALTNRIRGALSERLQRAIRQRISDQHRQPRGMPQRTR